MNHSLKKTAIFCLMAIMGSLSQVHAEPNGLVKTSYLSIVEKSQTFYIHIECSDPVRNDPRSMDFYLNIEQSAGVPDMSTVYFTNRLQKTYPIPLQSLKDAVTTQKLAEQLATAFHKPVPPNPVINEVMGNKYCSGQ